MWIWREKIQTTVSACRLGHLQLKCVCMHEMWLWILQAHTQTHTDPPIPRCARTISREELQKHIGIWLVLVFTRRRGAVPIVFCFYVKLGVSQRGFLFAFFFLFRLDCSSVFLESSFCSICFFSLNSIRWSTSFSFTSPFYVNRILFNKYFYFYQFHLVYVASLLHHELGGRNRGTYALNMPRANTILLVARGEPPRKRLAKEHYHYTCKECSQEKNKRTGHTQLKGRWYCPASGLTLDQWKNSL